MKKLILIPILTTTIFFLSGCTQDELNALNSFNSQLNQTNQQNAYRNQQFNASDYNIKTKSNSLKPIIHSGNMYFY